MEGAREMSRREGEMERKKWRGREDIDIGCDIIKYFFHLCACPCVSMRV